jgi:glycosyltransferase involved in cell wall biosynthesis
MHLIYVTSSLPFSAGETFIIAEILELRKRGHVVTVVPIRPERKVNHSDAQLLTGSTIREPILSCKIIVAAFKEFLRAPLLAFRSGLLLTKSRSFRVALKNLTILPKAMWVARIARSKRADHIHAHFASTNSTAALLASAVSGIPWSFTAHRWDIYENNLLTTKLKSACFARAIDRRGAQALSRFAGAHYHKVRVIHIGVEMQHCEMDAKPSPTLRVLMAARLDEIKGHRYALEAVARLKKAGIKICLYCVGDGPLKSTLQQYAVELDIMDEVHFPGLRDHQEILRRLREHRWDVALLASIENGNDHEGIPVFLIEAMAAGVPVVGTNTGGITELLEGGAGILVRQQDPNSIADALVRLAKDSGLLRKFGVAGIRRVREDYTVESTVSALLAEFALPEGLDVDLFQT